MFKTINSQYHHYHQQLTENKTLNSIFIPRRSNELPQVCFIKTHLDSHVFIN